MKVKKQALSAVLHASKVNKNGTTVIHISNVHNKGC